MTPPDALALEIAGLEQPTDSGRALHVGAFVLADPFDEMLRALSPEYLARAWQRLHGVLTSAQALPSDLSWGWLHPSEAWAPDVPIEPSSFTGWTSRELARFDRDPRWTSIDEQLRSGRP